MEGYNGLLSNLPDTDPFNSYDIVAMTETFLVKCPVIAPDGFYPFHSWAVPAVARGRPSGGISILCRAYLRPELLMKSNNYLCVRTTDALLCTFYFSPDTDIGEILTTVIHTTTVVADGELPIIVMGDFNCRVDGVRGARLTDGLTPYGFKLINDKDTPTYIDYHGNSAIDLVFVGLNARITAASQLVIPSTIRKHQKVVTVWTVRAQENVHQEPTRPQPLSRILDIQRFNESLDLNAITLCLDQDNIDEAVLILTSVIVKVCETTLTRYHHKPWFNTECRQKKRDLLALLQQILDHPGTTGRTTYNIARREYVKLIKEKRTQYQEEKLIKKIEETERKPWLLFRNCASKQAAPIPANRLRDHFQNLLDPFGAPPTLQETPQESFVNLQCWYNRPFEVQEVVKSIQGLSLRKAPGPDKIVNEHITTSLNCLHLERVWTRLFNACLDRSMIPTAWTTSIVKLLYKSKGEIDDPNNYRGIALLCCPLKLLTALLNRRIMTNIGHLLPPEQFGFLPGKSTLHPLRQLVNEVSNKLSQHRGKLYAAYIDFSKAFDMLHRGLLVTKIIHQFNIQGKVHALIRNLLMGNKIQIDDGIKLSDPIPQNNGVVQGDSLSPTLFLLFVADLSDRLRDIPNIQFSFYADDLVIYTEIPDSLRTALTTLNQWCQENHFKVNSAKSKIMKFRKGGRLSGDDHFQYGTDNLPITSSYEYLGVTFQQSLTFTEHFNTKKRKCCAIIGTLTHLQKVSIETGFKIFKLKIVPIVTYGLSAIAQHLNVKQLKTINQIKAAFVKKLLGVHTSTSSTLALMIVGEHTFIEDLQQTFAFNRTALADHLLVTDRRRAELYNEGYELGPAFTSRCWRSANQTNRHVLTRFTVHGFHHFICRNTSYHTISPLCECKLCGSTDLDRYHLSTCVQEWQAYIRRNSQ